MPVVARPLEPLFSDLVFHELDPSVGYARECINVTPPAASAPVLLGTVAVSYTHLTLPTTPYV